MKKTMILLIALALLIGTVSAAGIDLASSARCDFFSLTKIYDIDYNGKVFVGICQNRIATSRDFSDWNYADPSLPDVSALTRINGEFLAFGKGYTLCSADGTNWTRRENFLLAPVYDFVKCDKGLLLFCYDPDTGAAGTYWSKDGQRFQKVENIPDGGTMHIVNGKFVIESKGYMAGVYVSDNGVDFTRLDVPGFDLTYFGGAYHVMEYIPEVVGYNRQWTSDDLISWSSENVGYDYLYPHNSLLVEKDGIEYAYQMNANLLVYKNGVWKSTGRTVAADSCIANDSYVEYNLTDRGLFAWSNYGICEYICEDGTQKTYDGRQRMIGDQFVEDDAFYTVTNLIYTDGPPMVYRSDDGVTWTRDFDYPYDRWQSRLMMKAGNGKTTLESEFVERGSFAGREGNPVITATLTDERGQTSTVAYEYATDDYVQIQGGDGFFLLSGFPGSQAAAFYSPDGITRYPCTGGLLNSRALIKTDIYKGIMDIYGVNGLKTAFSNLPPTVKVQLNGEYLSFAVPPVIESDRVLIPLRFLFERAGATVDWNGGGAVIRYGDREIQVDINDSYAIVNGVRKELDVPARLIGEKMMVPLRFIAGECGFSVDYDETSPTVWIATADH